MLISPSIASFDVLNIANEVAYIDRYFEDIHIDIEDGMAVEGITFGMKVCKGIKNITSSKISIHLGVMEPLKYLEDVKECNPEIVFIQSDVIENPMEIIQIFKKKGIPVGLAITNRDMEKDYSSIFKETDEVLVTTAFVDDPEQIYQQTLEDYALNLAKSQKLKVWLDGGVTYDIYKRLKNSGINAVVMGREIYFNKEKFALCNIMG